MTTTATITGHAAIEHAEAHGLTLGKYTDPTEGARDGLTVDEARDVAAEDPSLVYLDLPASTTARALLTAADGDALHALENGQADVLRNGGEECQDWAGEATWLRFVDGSVMWVSGSSADERSPAEFDAALARDGAR